MAAATQDGVDRSAVRASPAPARQPPDADASSETSSVHSGETSDRRDADILTLVLSTRSEEYRLLFRLPPDEVLVQDFNCAFQENILLQGHMYLFIHHICFYSNIFGFETKKTIHFREVTCVRKAKTAAIFHNAIEIVAGGKKHFFGSFLSRDEAYRLIIDGWAQHNSEIKAFQENQDLKSEISSQENDMVCPKGSRLLGDDPSSSGRTKDDIIWNEPKISPIGEVDGKLTINITEDKENGREENTKLLITENTLTWIVEDVDAPKVPDHFTVVAEAKFPVLVEDFFSFFVSDNSFKFVEDFHKTCGDKDFQCTPWQKHEQFGHVRDVSFLHPIKVYLGAKSGHCQEVQKYRVYKNSHLMIETSQQIGDVPFGDYFHVEGIWDVEEDNDGKSCTLRVYSNVAFSKKTIFRGKIEQSTREECREVYAKWINLAHELLKKKKRRQSKGNEQTMSMVQPNGRQVLENSQNINGSVEKLHPTCSSRDIPLDMHNSRIQKPDINPGGLSTMVSLFPQSWATVVSYVKAQSPSALVLFVAFLAFMILMQMSIIVLLTRAPEVHLVSHRNDLSDIDRYSLENIEWIEKHFRYLKEEMFMVETRMERMRHEYALLKAHLQRLEHMKSKS